MSGNWKKMPYIDGSIMGFSKDVWELVEGFDENCFPGYFGENIFQFKYWLKTKISLRECNLETVHIHMSNHDNIDKVNIIEWTKSGREYFYNNYAIPNWDQFLEYLR